MHDCLRQLRLNQWVKQSTRWMQMEKWDACIFPVDEGELLERECYGGHLVLRGVMGK